MNIKKLSFDQIYVVSGGQDQPTLEQMRAYLRGGITDIGLGGRELDACLTIVCCGARCVTRCIPNKKPERCSYDAWGVLHDIDEGTIQKCKFIDEIKQIK